MPNNAMQFQPFDALKGFKEALRQVEKNIENKKAFDDDFLVSLDYKLQKIKIGDSILIKYYYNLEYIETIDIVQKVDKLKKMLILKNTHICLDDIIDITIINK